MDGPARHRTGVVLVSVPLMTVPASTPSQRAASAAFAALQRASRRIRPVLDAAGVLALGRRLVRGPRSTARLAASLLLDPPGARGTARVPFDGGTVTVVPGEAIGHLVTYGVPFEQFELEFFARIVTDGDVVLDVGANYGLYAILAARRVGRGAVHAFEPNPAVFELLEANVSPAAEGRSVLLHPIAVGDREGTARFLCTADSAYSSLVDTGRSAVTATVEVSQTTIDAFVSSHGLARVDLLKIDVEGFEPEVIAGARRLLGREDAPILLVEIAGPNLGPRGITQRDVVETLESLGYAVHVAERGLRPVRELPWDRGGVLQENFVAFKPARAGRLRPWMVDATPATARSSS
jgi:FkbM family methyltransferase